MSPLKSVSLEANDDPICVTRFVCSSSIWRVFFEVKGSSDSSFVGRSPSNVSSISAANFINNRVQAKTVWD